MHKPNNNSSNNNNNNNPNKSNNNLNNKKSNNKPNNKFEPTNIHDSFNKGKPNPIPGNHLNMNYVDYSTSNLFGNKPLGPGVQGRIPNPENFNYGGAMNYMHINPDYIQDFNMAPNIQRDPNIQNNPHHIAHHKYFSNSKTNIDFDHYPTHPSKHNNTHSFNDSHQSTNIFKSNNAKLSKGDTLKSNDSMTKDADESLEMQNMKNQLQQMQNEMRKMKRRESIPIQNVFTQNVSSKRNSVSKIEELDHSNNYMSKMEEMDTATDPRHRLGTSQTQKQPVQPNPLINLPTEIPEPENIFAAKERAYQSILNFVNELDIGRTDGSEVLTNMLSEIIKKYPEPELDQHLQSPSPDPQNMNAKGGTTLDNKLSRKTTNTQNKTSEQISTTTISNNEINVPARNSSTSFHVNNYIKAELNANPNPQLRTGATGQKLFGSNKPIPGQVINPVQNPHSNFNLKHHDSVEPDSMRIRSKPQEPVPQHTYAKHLPNPEEIDENFDLSELVKLFESSKFEIDEFSFKTINQLHANLKSLIKSQIHQYISSQPLFVKQDTPKRPTFASRSKDKDTYMAQDRSNSYIATSFPTSDKNNDDTKENEPIHMINNNTNIMGPNHSIILTKNLNNSKINQHEVEVNLPMNIKETNIPTNNFKTSADESNNSNLFDFIQKIQVQPEPKEVQNLKDIKNLELRSSNDYNGPSIQMSEQKLQNFMNLIHTDVPVETKNNLIKKDWTTNITKNKEEKKNLDEKKLQEEINSYETGLILFKIHDLRLRDHEAIFQANICCKHVIYLYVLEDDEFKSLNSLGFPKIGVHRRKFLLESLLNISYNISEKSKAANSLLVKVGDLCPVIEELVEMFNINAVFTHTDIDYVAVKSHEQLKTCMKNRKVDFHEYYNHTLVHIEDLSFKVTKSFPECYKEFRETIVNNCIVRNIIESYETMDRPAPSALPLMSEEDIIEMFRKDVWMSPEFIPKLFLTKKFDPDTPFSFESGCPMLGGEDMGLERVYDYMMDKRKFGHLKKSKNYLLGVDISTKIGAYLAFGNISAKQLYKMTELIGLVSATSKDMKYFVYKLIWRDFFKFYSIHMGVRSMDLYGIQGLKFPHTRSYMKWNYGVHTVLNWVLARTHYPIINAISRELLYTGLISHRARVISACYLAKYLQVDWRFGMEFYEHAVVDYDFSICLGNWMYYANVGPVDFDGIDKYFNLEFQKTFYDKNDIYVKYWLPDYFYMIKEKKNNIKIPNASLKSLFYTEVNLDYDANDEELN